MKHAPLTDWTGFSCTAISCLVAVLFFTFFYPPTFYILVLFIIVALILLRCTYVRSIAPLYSFSRCVAPLAFGSILVAIYIKLHQSNSLLGYDLTDYFGGNLSDIVNLAQFNPLYKEQFYTAMATLYAIVLALALIKNMEEIEKAKGRVEEEAALVRSSAVLLQYFEDDEIRGQKGGLEAKYAIFNELLSYTQNCSSGQDGHKSAENARILQRCQGYLINLTPCDDDDAIAKSELIQKLEQIYLLRLRRIEFFSRRTKPFLVVALWFMALAMILPFLAEPICTEAAGKAEIVAVEKVATHFVTGTHSIRCESPLVPHPQRYSQYYMIFILTAFLSFMMLMLHDVSNPHGGFWQVDLQEFTEALSDLRAMATASQQA